MSGAGRGTPRVSPLGGLPNKTDLPGGGNWTYLAATPGPWQGVYVIDEPPDQALTDTFANYEYPSLNFRVPLGTVRGSLFGSYTPGQVGGLLQIFIQWRSEDTNPVYVMDVGNLTAAQYGPAAPADPYLANIPSYDLSKQLPPATGTDPILFLLPFWVPPVRVYNLQPADEAFMLSFRVMVRDAAGTPGTVNIQTVVAESFGQPHPVSTV